MIRFLASAPFLALLIPATLVVPPAHAASFDCGAASTPFEHAICDTPDLSAADDTLAKAFATALGGLTKPAAGLLRSDQRDWLDFAQAACTDNAEALTTGRYDDEGAQCLVGLFNDRVKVLEGSRMVGGHRFIVTSLYSTLPDPDGANDPDYYWKIATHELAYPLLDEDDPLGDDFNPFMSRYAENEASLNSSSGGEEVASTDAQSDTDVTITVDAVTANRISLKVSSYWYGHGAAHGNWGISYAHYLPAEKRELEASDIFSGKGWEDKLAQLAFARLQADHGEWLQIESADDIADAVIRPDRWSFDSDYGLTLQFEPYEVSAYAYGAPTVVVSWDDLTDFTSSNLDSIRYGF